MAAYPESVNVLDGISGDVRTPDKLINGENDTNNGDHMWLAPILPSIVSVVIDLVLIINQDAALVYCLFYSLHYVKEKVRSCGPDFSPPIISNACLTCCMNQYSEVLLIQC